LLAAIGICATTAFAKDAWFDQRVTWKYGNDGREWKTTIPSTEGHEKYQLVLQPLWALEGGVIALEVVLARPTKPDTNLLGERENGREYPFVITVEELERGLAKTTFGAVRRLQAGNINLTMKIENFHLGKGVGSGSTYCAKCRNLQELSLRILIESKTE